MVGLLCQVIIISRYVRTEKWKCASIFGHHIGPNQMVSTKSSFKIVFNRTESVLLKWLLVRTAFGSSSMLQYVAVCSSV